MEDDRASIFAREGQEFPGATYKEVVLEPAYENAKRELLPAMLAANRAHLIMLVEQNLVSRKDADAVMLAIAELDETEAQTSPYTGEFEDLFFHVEHLILESAGEPAGNLHLARSRNDLGVAMYRMVLRDRLLRAACPGRACSSFFLTFRTKTSTERSPWAIVYPHTRS